MVDAKERADRAEAKPAAVKERREEVGQDEGWWVGGAWGDYGDALVPLRISSYVIGGELDQKVASIDPGFALTCAEQVARADRGRLASPRLGRCCPRGTSPWRPRRGRSRIACVMLSTLPSRRTTREGHHHRPGNAVHR